MPALIDGSEHDKSQTSRRDGNPTSATRSDPARSRPLPSAQSGGPRRPVPTRGSRRAPANRWRQQPRAAATTRVRVLHVYHRRAAPPTGTGSAPAPRARRPDARDRKSVVQGKSVSVRVDLGGLRIIKKKKQKSYTKNR